MSFFRTCDRRGGLLSIVSLDNDVAGCALYLACPVLATVARAFILDTFLSLANPAHASP